MNFRYRLMQFMSGRYGTDNLSYGLLLVSVIIAIINTFLRSGVVQLVVYALIIYCLFRIFSRNLEARRRENRFFNEKINFFKNKVDLYHKRKNDKCHIYKKCPSCKAVLRLPHRIGKHTTSCPRCGKEFRVNVRK